MRLDALQGRGHAVTFWLQDEQSSTDHIRDNVRKILTLGVVGCEVAHGGLVDFLYLAFEAMVPLP